MRLPLFLWLRPQSIQTNDNPLAEIKIKPIQSGYGILKKDSS